MVLFVGAHQALDGDLTIGSLIVFISYLTILQIQFAGLTGVYTSLQAARRQHRPCGGGFGCAAGCG